MHRIAENGEATALFFGVRPDQSDCFEEGDPRPVRVTIGNLSGLTSSPIVSPKLFNNVGDEISRAYAFAVGTSTLCVYMTWHPTTAQAELDATRQVIESIRDQEIKQGTVRITFTLDGGWDTG